MRAACSAWPVICVRRKRRTDRGAHACGRCALPQADGSFLPSGDARCALRFALPRTACAFDCGGFAFRQAGCSLLSSGGARCALRSALPRTAYAFGCGGCARGGARSGGLERGPLCRPGEAQCADGRPTVAPREPTPRQREIARCQRRDDARCLVPPSAWAPRLPATLPPCRGGCGCAARVAEGPPLLFPMCAAGWADRTFALPPCREGCGGLAFFIRAVRRRVGRSNFRTPAVPRGLRRARLCCSRCAPQGGPIGLSRSRRAAQFAVVPRGLRRACLLHSRRAP